MKTKTETKQKRTTGPVPRTLYLSGPMEGSEDYAEKFSSVAAKLREAGHTVFNPAGENPEKLWKGWDDAEEWELRNAQLLASELSEPRRRIWLRDDIIALAQCNGIVALPGSDKSRGALAEFMWADAVGMEKFFWALKEDREKLLHGEEPVQREGGAQ